jgi:hypothetical protein
MLTVSRLNPTTICSDQDSQIPIVTASTPLLDNLIQTANIEINASLDSKTQISNHSLSACLAYGILAFQSIICQHVYVLWSGKFNI